MNTTSNWVINSKGNNMIAQVSLIWNLRETHSWIVPFVHCTIKLWFYVQSLLYALQYWNHILKIHGFKPRWNTRLKDHNTSVHASNKRKGHNTKPRSNLHTQNQERLLLTPFNTYVGCIYCAKCLQIRTRNIPVKPAFSSRLLQLLGPVKPQTWPLTGVSAHSVKESMYKEVTVSSYQHNTSNTKCHIWE